MSGMALNEDSWDIDWQIRTHWWVLLAEMHLLCGNDRP